LDFLFKHGGGAFERHLKVGQRQGVDELIRLLVEEELWAKVGDGVKG